MKYKKEFLQFQKLFEKALKKRYKSIVDVKVNYEEFERVFEKNSVFNLFDVTVYWDVKIAVAENEEVKGLAQLGKSIFEVMFNISAFPWINLEKVDKNEDLCKKQ